MGVASCIIGIVVQRAEVASRGGTEGRVCCCGPHVIPLVVKDFPFPVIRLSLKLGVDLEVAAAFEKGQGLLELLVLVKLDGAVEGQGLCRGTHSFIWLCDVGQGRKRPFVVPARHVDLQQEPVGFVPSGGRWKLGQVSLEGDNGVVERIEGQLKGQLRVVEEGIFLDVHVEWWLGSSLESLLGPCPIAEFQVAIGHVVGRILGKLIVFVGRQWKTVERSSPVPHLVARVAHLIGKFRLTSGAIGFFPGQF